MDKILVVDDEKNIRDVLAIALKKEGYLVSTADDGDTALNLLCKEHFDLMLADVRMPRMNGLTLLRKVQSASPETVTIMITADTSSDTAVTAMKEGAYDYLTKPFRQLDEIVLVIQNALERKRLKQENIYLKQEIKKQAAVSHIIGKSRQMRDVLQRVEKVAESQGNVLILGESGTGKELIARSVHFNSPRRDRPFVTVNCGALPEPLLESELFGHMKGAFTGAVSNKEGLFEVAHSGSIFLDEIGDTPLSIQVKLLRVLQEKEFRRVGGTKDIKVDVRIIAATNQNLKRLVSEEKFREDLYYRLNVIPIVLPPLRDHLEDIPLLADFFIKRFNRGLGKEVKGINDQAMAALMQREWKGNIRELENLLESAIALSSGEVLTLTDFNEEPRDGEGRDSPTPSTQEGLEDAIGKIEKELLLKALEETNGVQTEAAKRLQINFRSFRYRLQKYGIHSLRTRKDQPLS